MIILYNTVARCNYESLSTYAFRLLFRYFCIDDIASLRDTALLITIML